jgi:acetylornithine deacetylase/succinyl-diaminopimelate desuccinylase-like protein
VTSLLAELLRAETVNPPGNEIRAAEVLRAYFERNGIECSYLARAPERPNVLARLRGDDGPTLCFLSHTDTVLADPGEWDRDPFSGEVIDGEIWGRGALDMKGQVAASAVALASLRRDGVSLAGDVLFLSVADEEVGGVGADVGFGLRWLVEAHPDAVRCDFAINEGGGERLLVDGKPYYLCATAEKRSSPFHLRVRGRSGHGSMPGIADNALVKAARHVTALAELEPEPRLIPEARAFLEAVLGYVPEPREALAAAQSASPLVAAVLEPLLSFTLAPTVIEASRKHNVIPGLCELTVDCRLLPEQAPEEVEPLIRDALPDGEVELEWEVGLGGTRSPLDTPLWEALAAFTEGIEEGAVLVPFACPGFTDSHYLREAFGTVAYGFFPIKAMPPELAVSLVHSANERIAVDDLELGVEMLRFVARTLLAR